MTEIPIDPADIDRLAPADLDICGACNGNGDVPLGNPENPDTDWLTCTACAGSGFAVHYWNGSAA